MKPIALPVKLEGIPNELKAKDRWVLWKYVEKTKPNGEKVWTKVPFSAKGGMASSTNPDTWCSFDEAFDEYLMGEYDGIGLTLGGPLHGIDLDDCRDPVTGSLSELAQETLDRVEGYAEVSPSGTGLKIFTQTNLDGSRTKKEMGVELYKDGRYFAVTGHAINGHDGMPVLPQDLGWLVERVWGEGLSAAASGDAFANLKGPLDGWDLDRVVDEVLVHLDPDTGYGEWLKVGAAMHHQGEGGHDWLEAWDNWSAASGKWIDGQCLAKWDSFSQQRSTGRGPVTLASLLHMTKDKREVAKLDQRDMALSLVLDMVAACTDVRHLQEKIAAGIAHSAEVSDLEREQIANAIKSKAKDLGTKLPLATVRGWVRSRVIGGESFLFCNSQGHPLCTLENMRTLFVRLGYIIRYNVIKKSIEILIPNGAFTRDNRDNAAIAHVLSECEKARMPTKHVSQFTIALADSNQYNPVMIWIESREWDGVSRLTEFYATLESKSPLKEMLIRKWLIQAVAAVASPNGIAGQGILTLVGKQNIGKTTWFQGLAPPELDAIFTGLILDLRSKDSIFIALTYWIVELGELDATIRKSDFSALKSFVTQPIDKLRRPYAATESTFGRRTVFGASVNDEKFLHDPTGNRRFFSLLVDGFTHDHTVDMQQLWAEILLLWRAGEKWGLDQDEAELLSAENRHFTIDDPIYELIASYFDRIQMGSEHDWKWKWVTATKALIYIGVQNPTSNQTMKAGRAIRSLNNNQHRHSNGNSLLAIPFPSNDSIDF